jgi:hypothetical protein
VGDDVVVLVSLALADHQMTSLVLHRLAKVIVVVVGGADDWLIEETFVWMMEDVMVMWMMALVGCCCVDPRMLTLLLTAYQDCHPHHHPRSRHRVHCTFFFSFPRCLVHRFVDCAFASAVPVQFSLPVFCHICWAL